MNRRAIVAANWKMNGSLALVNSMVSELNSLTLNENVEVVVCPSFPYLAAFNLVSTEMKLPKAFSLGAQNLNEMLKVHLLVKYQPQCYKKLVLIMSY